MAHQFNLLKPVEQPGVTTSEKTHMSSAGVQNQTPPAPQNAYDSGKLKSLTRSICKIDPDTFPEVIIVATAVSSQDKGIVASHLASDIAGMPGKSVFLIDADLQSPSLHSRFDYSEQPGLAEYLAGKSGLASLILETPVEGLQLLPAGNAVRPVHSTLSCEKMTRFIRELKTKCPGLVIVINMDINVFSEAHLPFTDYVDGSIISIDDQLESETDKSPAATLSGNVKLLGSIRISSPSSDTEIQSPEVESPAPETIQEIQPQLVSKTDDCRIVSLTRPNSFEAEQFNKLTADMIKSDILKKHHVFMFTSPSSGDGKSYVSANAAVSLAQNTGKQVLIIDCDLRSPSVHTYFNRPNTTGLNNFLSGEESQLSDCIQSTDIDNLSMISAGNSDANPLQLLSSDKMQRLITGLTKRFKNMIIILDAAPPSIMAEGNVVSKLAESIILIASHNRTNRDEMKRLAGMFKKEKIYGVVYNNYSGKRNPYYSYKSDSDAKKAA